MLNDDKDARASRKVFFDAMGDTVPNCALDGPQAWDNLQWKQQQAVCLQCPLLGPCRTYADSLGSTISGIWAGRSYPRTPADRAKENL